MRRITTRLLIATASSTDTSTPMKTRALTNHVVPNSRANCTTFFVSRSRKATPMKNRSANGRIWRSGPPTVRTASRESASMTAIEIR